MLDALIERTLAQIDDLAELKVTLVALWLIQRKGGGVASIDAPELSAQPALRQGLGFAPDLAIDAALKRAVARGTLIAVRPAAQTGPRYLWASDAALRWAAQAEAALARSEGKPVGGPSDALAIRLARLIEKLEQVEAFALDGAQRALLDEFLASGYTATEIETALQRALRAPRASGSPARGLGDVSATLATAEPAQPSAYYRWKAGAMKVPPDGMVAFRERSGRWPTGSEYDVIVAAIGLYGEPAVVRTLAQTLTREVGSLNRLLPALLEAQEASLAIERASVKPDPKLIDLQTLYEGFTGLPPTGAILTDMRQLLATDVPDLAVWKAAFEYSAVQNKRDWRYARAVALNPKPGVYVPAPVNDTARAAFDEYRRRVGRLDEFIATEINALSQSVPDPARWKDAIDKAAAANLLRWDYIKAVLTNPANDSHAKQAQPKTPARRGGADRAGRGSSVRLPQVDDPSDSERASAQERARRQRAERASKRTG